MYTILYLRYTRAFKVAVVLHKYTESYLNIIYQILKNKHFDGKLVLIKGGNETISLKKILIKSMRKKMITLLIPSHLKLSLWWKIIKVYKVWFSSAISKKEKKNQLHVQKSTRNAFICRNNLFIIVFVDLVFHINHFFLAHPLINVTLFNLISFYFAGCSRWVNFEHYGQAKRFR